MKQVIHTLSDHNAEVLLNILDRQRDGLLYVMKEITGDGAIANTQQLVDALGELKWYVRREKRWLKGQQGPLSKET